MELKEGEVLCPDCKGSGNQAKWDTIPDYRVTLECETCNGTGKLDWIEAVVGKKKELEQIKFRTLSGFNYLKNPNNIIGNCTS